ncbi:MAG TPA: protein kinase, partial [Bryobacterales bacterium]|nr:protein kinase [Bryobacterales bacterium]
MTTLGKYEILDTLGSGGMGTVYRARDPVLEREVAIKVISTVGGAGEVKERFYREARACAQLQHPHIVAVYDLGEQDDQAYIVMELLIGADLKRIIADRHSLPLEAKIELSLQVLEGLGHAHRNGIVHRDIKPGNIFVHQDNCAKILDFGIARVPFSKLTLAGSALGTPEYMAPEQIAGQVCDARSDLFSTALVLFEFLSYVHPFPGPNAAGRIVTEQPPSLSAANPELPAWLEAVIAKGLEKTPGRRYQTAEEFATALQVAGSGGVRPRRTAPALPFTLPGQGARPGAGPPPLASAAAVGAGARPATPARKTGPLPFALPRRAGLNAAAAPPARRVQEPGLQAGNPGAGAPQPGGAPALQRFEPPHAPAEGRAAVGRAATPAKDPPQAASAPAPRDTPAAEEPPPKAPLPRLPSLTPPEGPIAGAAAAT